MFDVAAPFSTEIGAWTQRLASAEVDADDHELIDQIRELEDLKAAAAAAQARLTARFDASQRQAQADAGIPARRQGEGIASQIALARRESPVRGAIHLGLAKILTTEMPCTLAAMTTDGLSEWRAMLLVRETACLTLADRQTVDATLCGNPETLEGLSDRALVAEVKRLAYKLDPEAAVRRASRAEADRFVSLRPAPDTMSWLSASLPVVQGVSVFAALGRAADSLRAAGDPRSRSQIMADTLVERVTGLTRPGDVPVEVKLVMTDRSWLQGDSEPAHLEGYGPVPAGWARDLVADAIEGTRAWIRRLYTAPGDGRLIAMDSRARCVPEGLGSFVEARDQFCRTPWCGAPLRHKDHAVPHDADGETSEPNIQGLCERCNHAKQAMGWRARPRPGPRHTVETTTPTGHTYRSTAPPPPGTGIRIVPGWSEIEPGRWVRAA